MHIEVTATAFLLTRYCALSNPNLLQLTLDSPESIYTVSPGDQSVAEQSNDTLL